MNFRNLQSSVQNSAEKSWALSGTALKEQWITKIALSNCDCSEGRNFFHNGLKFWQGLTLCPNFENCKHLWEKAKAWKIGIFHEWRNLIIEIGALKQCGGSRRFGADPDPLLKLMRIQILLPGWEIIFNYCFQSRPILVMCNFLSKNARGRVRGEG